MKKYLALLAAFVTLAGYSQTTNGTTTVGDVLKNGWQFVGGQGTSNLNISSGATYTTSIKTWGGYLELERVVPVGTGLSVSPGIGLDLYDKNLYSVSGQGKFQADLLPFSGFVGTNSGGFVKWIGAIKVSPFGKLGVGTPIKGLSNSTALETIESGGVDIHLINVLGGSLGIDARYGTRQGLGRASGSFWGGGISMRWGI